MARQRQCQQQQQLPPKTHTLVSGATIMSLSGHEFRFSDGTVAEPQEATFVAAMNLERANREVGTIKGMKLSEVRMRLSDDQISLLAYYCQQADLVIVPLPVLLALREQGIRDQFPNAVAFNATAETMRSPPNEKIVDIDNWSY